MSTDLPAVARGPSIFEFIRSRLDEGGRLSDPGVSLPDDAQIMSGGLKWVAGALDGAFGHHGGTAESPDPRAEKAANAFVLASRKRTKRRLRQLHDAVRDDSVLDYLDAMIEALVERQPDRDRLRELGRWLATTAADRGAVKVGLAVLGVTGVADDVDVVRALGAHEEFTLYAAVALTNGLDDPESELWALASAVDGWGRIHCVERLRDTTDPAIRAWILRGGFRNSIMYEYLAHIAATTGGLLEALQTSDPDRELLAAAGEILEALIAGGPAEDIGDYDDGADAVEAYLGHMSKRAETLLDFQAIVAIRSFLARDDGWEELGVKGWSATRREAFEARCDDLLNRDEWSDRIAVALLSDGPGEFWRADQAARHLGIDTFDLHVQKIKQNPLGQSWFNAWQQANTSRAEELASLARDLLPLSDIGTGPRDELGMGPGWEAHHALDWTLQELRSHPGVGEDLVLVGLQSPVTRNRNMALNVLKDWPRSGWPAGARDLAQALARSDPDDQAREFAGQILREARP